MDPKIAEMWNDGLVRLKKAEEYLTAGESELVKTEAQHAAMAGIMAITFLLREDDKKTCSIALDETFDRHFFEWEKDCSRPEDYIAKARKLLRNYSNLSPPENKLPFE
jgi:HEPN domain-containing protein